MSYPQHPGYGPPPPQHYGGYGPPPPQHFQPHYPPPPPQAYQQQQQQMQPQQQPPPQPQAPAQAAPAAAPAVPFIGAYISLLSVLNVRYEGTLYTIDTKASTVALQNVRCFGTEDRPAPQFTPVDPHVYEFIIFGGKDIVDLSVLVQPTPQQAPPQPQQQPPQQQPQQPQQPAAPQQQQQQQPQQDQQQQRGSRPPRQNQPPQPQGARLSVRMIDGSEAKAQPKPQEQKQQAPAPAAASSSAGAADFDFQGSNARFEKVHAPASYAGAAASSSSSAPAGDDSSVPSYELPSVDSGLDTSGFPTVTKKYDKAKSFFDELGSGSSETRVASNYSNQGQQRRVDVDTFGAEAQGFRSKHGRQGGGHRQGGGGQGQGGQGGGQRRGGGGRGRNGNAPQGQWRGDAQ